VPRCGLGWRRNVTFLHAISDGVGAGNLVTRTAPGTAGFEGIGILPDGTAYLDPDDSGFGAKNGGPGDANFRLIPDHRVPDVPS
jgi:hypothetical protein